MNDVIKIIKSLEDLNVLIDGIIETVKHKKKKKKRRQIFSCFARTFGCFKSTTSDFKMIQHIIGITKYFNYKPGFNGIFLRSNLSKNKRWSVCDKSQWQKKEKEYIAFHYLLTEILLFIFILLELNIFLKKYEEKSQINQLRTIYLEYNDNGSIICQFYCITFVEYILVGKTWLDYTNLFSLNEPVAKPKNNPGEFLWTKN